MSGPPHLHSCSILLTRTVHLAEALPLPLWCQNKYHSFIWSCAAPWEEALTPARASLSTPTKKVSCLRMGTRILTSPVCSKLGHHYKKVLCLRPLPVECFCSYTEMQDLFLECRHRELAASDASTIQFAYGVKMCSRFKIVSTGLFQHNGDQTTHWLLLTDIYFYLYPVDQRTSFI